MYNNLYNSNLLAVPAVLTILVWMVLKRYAGYRNSKNLNSFADTFVQTMFPSSLLLWAVLYLVFKNS